MRSVEAGDRRSECDLVVSSQRRLQACRDSASDAYANGAKRVGGSAERRSLAALDVGISASDPNGAQGIPGLPDYRLGHAFPLSGSRAGWLRCLYNCFSPEKRGTDNRIDSRMLEECR